MYCCVMAVHIQLCQAQAEVVSLSLYILPKQGSSDSLML